MVEGFFSSAEPEGLRKAVLIAASYAKGGISEWIEMNCDEFVLWLDALKELNRNGK